MSNDLRVVQPAVTPFQGTIESLSGPEDVASKKKQQEHLAYLKRISEGSNPSVRGETANLARSIWEKILRVSNNRMPVPAACTGPDGQILYAWDKGRHHLEVEIFADKPAEFFYRDRETGEVWGEDHVVDDNSLPAGAADKLELFI